VTQITEKILDTPLTTADVQASVVASTKPDPLFTMRAVMLLAMDILLITIGIHQLEPISELLATSYFIPIVAAAYWWETIGAITATIICLALYAFVSLATGGEWSFVAQQLVIKGMLFYFAAFTASLVSRERRNLLVRLRKDEIQTIGALATAIDAKDPFTHRHSEQVMKFAVMIGKAMGLSDEQLELLEYQAMLHDIGNIGVPDHILHKPGRLSPEEMEVVKGHVSIGGDIVKRIDAEGKLARGVQEHQERFDGKGYPRGLRGEEISLNGRILAVADSFTAMISDRPYRKALTFEEAIRELEANAGTQFDPHVVDVFVRLLRSSPPPEATSSDGSATRS